MTKLQELLIRSQLETLAAVGVDTIKNPQSKKKFKRLFLMIYKMIKSGYAGDKDFN